MTFAASFPSSPSPCGRLAPSPTGLLHLGNAWSFLLAWLAARQEGGRVVLRMEDIDPDRSRPEWTAAILDDLAWLGLDWDEGPVSLREATTDKTREVGPHAPYEQSRSGFWYEAAFRRLEKAGLIYPCYCTRKELRTLAGAPHGYSSLHGGAAADGAGDIGAPYSGVCRNLTPEERRAREESGRRSSWRLACPAGAEEAFDDAVLGPQRLSLDECGGDFPLRRSDGVWSYQLAVTVDDGRMGVTQVVRGEDILPSTPRQLLLFRLLGGPDCRPPSYAHVPLLHDEMGERLAKRHQSLSLRALREAGVRPEAVTGWLAGLSPAGGGGWAGNGDPAGPRELLDRLRRHDRTFPWKRLRRSGPERLRVPAGLADLLIGR